MLGDIPVKQKGTDSVEEKSIRDKSWQFFKYSYK